MRDHTSSPCPFDFKEFWYEHDWLTPAQMGLAMTLTMMLWNTPGFSMKLDREGIRNLFQGGTDDRYTIPDRDIDQVLECAFWYDQKSKRLHSPWIQKWACIPVQRTPVPRHIRSIIRRRDMHNGRLFCAYCSEDCTFDHHFDHRLPMSRGGIHHPDNISIACPTCNLRKGGMTDNEFSDLILETMG